MAHHFQNPDGVNINAEFGRLSHTPPPTDKDPQATWSSPRRKRGWAWVSAKHDRSSSGLDVDECKENCRPPALTRRKSIKNMFSSVRNGLLQYNQMPTGDDLKGCAQDAHQADTQLKPAAEKATEIANKLLRPQAMRRSKSLNFLGSIGQTFAARRGSKQRLGMLRVYPGIDQLSRNQEVWDEEGSSSKNCDPDSVRPLESGERTNDIGNNYTQKLEPLVPTPNIDHDRAGKLPESAGRVHFEEHIYKRALEQKLMNKNHVEEKPGSFDSESTIAEQPSELDSGEEDSSNSRGNTPDSYLELLIESLCPPSDSDTSSRSSSVSLYIEDRTDYLPPLTMEEMEANRIAQEQENAAGLLKSLEQSDIPVLEPQYCSDGYEISNHQHHMEQLPIVSVREVITSSKMTITPLSHNICGSTADEEYDEYEYQSDGLTSHERIKTRIQRTLAVMTRNRCTSSGSEEDSDFEVESPLVSNQKSKNNSEVSEPTSVSASDSSRVMTLLRPHPRPTRTAVVREGRKLRLSSSNYEHDSGVSWAGDDTEDDEDDQTTHAPWKQSKGEKSTMKRTHSTSDNQPTYRAVQQASFKEAENLRNQSFDLHGDLFEGKELLSGWGRSSFSSPPELTFSPVQVNFPETATREGHTELYDTRSEAITAIFHENHGEFDTFCTFDPTIRVIFVHPLGKFNPDYDEIDKLGLEILSLPANYDFDPSYGYGYCPRPLFSPRFECSSVHEMGERIFGVNELAALFSETHLTKGKGKAAETIEGQSTNHTKVAPPSGMVPPNPPTSSLGTSPDVAEMEERGSTFDDDFFLEVDLASQRSNSTCDIWQTSSDQADDSQQSDSASLNRYSVSPKVHSHLWDAKTWPELGREYITTLDSTDSKISVCGNRADDSASRDDVELGGECSINLNIPCHKRQRNDSSGGVSESELRTAESRGLQQAIDEIVAMKGHTLDRGIALLPKSNSGINSEEYYLQEDTVQPLEVRQAESKVPHVQDIVDQFEDRAAESNAGKQEMRTFSYPLEYSPPQSRIDLDLDQRHHADLNRSHQENQRCVSGASDQSHATGFRFTDYIQELAEIASNGSVCASNVSYDMGKRTIASVEPCRTPVNANGSPRAITAADLNVRVVGKAAQESKLAQQDAKGGALVGLFQSHGLMPQSQPTLRNPTTLGSSPFKNITNQMPSANSSPTAARNGNSEADVEKTAKATAFKRAFSELSVGSSSHDTDTLDFEEAYQVLEQMRLS